MEVSPGVGQTSYDAYVIFNSDTVQVVTSSAIVHETYDKDTIYREVCQSDTRYTFPEPVDRYGNPVFKDLNISTSHDYQPIRETLQTVYGCDSVITLMLKVNPVYEFNATDNICQSDTPYVWRNRNLYETGVYYDTLKTTCCNCDSVYVLNLIVAPMPEISFVPENPAICIGDEIEIAASVTNCNDFSQVPLYEGFDGVRGNSSESLKEASIKTMTTMFESGNLVFPEGDSSIRLGNSSHYGYIVSRQLDLSYDFTLELRMKGWDSQVIPVPTRVRVSIDGVQEDTLTVLGGIANTSPAQYETFSINFNEASSNSVLRIETINERVIDPSADTLYSFAQERVFIDWVRISDNSSCTYSWSAGGSPIPGGSSITVSPENTTTYNVIVQSKSGCKEKASVEVVVNEPTEGDDIVFSCGSYTWIDGITYDETPEENPSIKLQDHNGCDSTVTLHLTIGQTVGEFSAIACGSYTWEGETYTESGDYEHIYTSSEGCDSVVTLHLTVTAVDSVHLYDEICAGGTYSDYGFSYTAPYSTTLSIHYDTLRLKKAGGGCDSIVTLTLTVNPVDSIHFDTETVCAGGTYDAHGFHYDAPYSTTASVHYDTLRLKKAGSSCDSIVTLILTVNPVDSIHFDTETVCAGGTYDAHGFHYDAPYSTTASVHYDTLRLKKTGSGCDSIVTLTLTVNPVDSIHFDTETVCAGGTYDAHGFHYDAPYSTTASVHYDTLRLKKTGSGCDSIVTLTLTVNPVDSVHFDDVVCAGKHYGKNGFSYDAPYSTTASVHYDTLRLAKSGVDGCDSIVTLTLTVNPVDSVHFDDVVCAGKHYEKNGFSYDAPYSTTASVH